MTRQQSSRRSANDQRRAPRVLPGRALHQVSLRFVDEPIKLLVGLLDESLDGIAVQTRHVQPFTIGRLIEVAVEKEWREATVVRATRRGPYFRIGLEWCEKPVERLVAAK